MKKAEEDIIHSLKRGENEGYKYIFDHHYPLLCSIASEFLKDDFLAETIVEDLIFHIWERREVLDINTSLRSYLVRAVRNRCINYLQLERERKEITFSTLGLGEEKEILYTESQDYPLATLLENELEEKISQSIQKLPKECRQVFQMSRFEEKRYDEIADALDISVNTVKYHMKRALKLLSDDLGKYLYIMVICSIFS